jgi:uncharacterized membrane protein YqjE
MAQRLIDLWHALSTASDSTIAVLVLGMVALMFSHWQIRRSYKERLADKDKHIEELIVERNRLQDVLLKQVGVKRESSEEAK